ncbi:ATP-binding cassette domain-containing protein [Halocatena marina]|uniref:ATP-binding cassette domain-containing protein n=1 Tax=Halocatena marina TaxID=2934937 RepID=UPI0022247C4F|nr:ATP-binding cassette domain-containing protein [Halocatena marina]
MTDPLLTVDWVIKTFGGLTAIDGAAFDVSAASITGLIGPNGARKTTLFDVVTGVYTLDSGRMLFQGEEISGQSSTEIARQGIGRTFQMPRLFEGMTVLENIRFAAMNQMSESVLGVFTKPETVRNEERAIRTARRDAKQRRVSNASNGAGANAQSCRPPDRRTERRASTTAHRPNVRPHRTN